MEFREGPEDRKKPTLSARELSAKELSAKELSPEELAADALSADAPATDQPVTAKTSTLKPATADAARADYRVSLADLEPARGLVDELDDVIFGLCDSSFLDTFTTSIPGTDEPGHLARFCHHLRLTTNADTVYLCDQQSLQIETTTSIEFAEDTADMHRALTSAISNLDECSEAFTLPGVRVFPDHARLSFTVIPLGPQPPLREPSRSNPHSTVGHLAVIVDADHEYQITHSCLTTAVQALADTFAAVKSCPDTKQLQRSVFDRLKRQHHLCSANISNRRQEIFQLDLQHVTVHFEKLLALDTISASSAEKDNTASASLPMEAWGWHAVASLLEDDHFPEALYEQAHLWGEAFTTELDTHILTVATLRYKDVCEAANLNSFDNIKPLCLKTHAGSIRQELYTDTLQQLTEMGVIRGSQLLLELSEQSSVCTTDCTTTESECALRDFNEQLQAFRDRFNVQIGLSEFGTGHSSLQRLNTLNPDVIRPATSLLPNSDLPVDEWLDSARQLPYLTGATTGRAKSGRAMTGQPVTAQILVDGSQLRESGEPLPNLFETPETTVVSRSGKKSLAA
jgi:hypothetical protein